MSSISTPSNVSSLHLKLARNYASIHREPISNAQPYRQAFNWFTPTVAANIKTVA